MVPVESGWLLAPRVPAPLRRGASPVHPWHRGLHCIILASLLLSRAGDRPMWFCGLVESLNLGVDTWSVCSAGTWDFGIGDVHPVSLCLV